MLREENERWDWFLPADEWLGGETSQEETR
jgi:hypothetical protein